MQKLQNRKKNNLGALVVGLTGRSPPEWNAMFLPVVGLFCMGYLYACTICPLRLRGYNFRRTWWGPASIDWWWSMHSLLAGLVMLYPCRWRRVGWLACCSTNKNQSTTGENGKTANIHLKPCAWLFFTQTTHEAMEKLPCCYKVLLSWVIENRHLR